METEDEFEEIIKPKKSFFKTWSSEKMVSYTAFFISVISLIALLYQSYLAREENKLIQMQQSASVLPYLNQWYSDDENGFKIIVGNKGVGPAFIKDIHIELDDEKEFDNSDDLFQEIFKSLQKNDTVNANTSTLIKGFVLPAEDQINIIEIPNLKQAALFKRIFNTKKIIFKITYADVYGTKWVLSNEDPSIKTHSPKLVED